MTDEQIPPLQPAQPSLSPNFSFLDKLTMDPSALWQEHKTFLIVFGLLIVVIKFRGLIMDFLVSDSKAILDSAIKKDNSLKNEEDKANLQANQLIDDSKKLKNNELKVDANWNLKK